MVSSDRLIEELMTAAFIPRRLQKRRVPKVLSLKAKLAEENVACMHAEIRHQKKRRFALMLRSAFSTGDAVNSKD
jgi:hypothetical protein